MCSNTRNFVSMNHQGDSLRALLKAENVTLSELARRMHVHANTVTNYVQSAEIKLDIWRQIGTALKKDLSELVPGLPASAPRPADEAGPAYALPTGKVPATLTSCQQELMRLQSAYINLMNDHLALVRSTAANAPAA